MDKYGNIYEIKSEEQLAQLEALRGEIIEVPQEDVNRVKHMNRKERRQYYRKHRKKGK